MFFFNMPKLTIGDLTCKLPIIQGGMGVGISLSGLASAVANQGGIGVIAANGIGMIEDDYYENGRQANIRALSTQIRKARQKSQGIIGVNIMIALNDFTDMITTAIEEKVDILFLGAGLPIKDIPVQTIRQNNIKVVPIVSSGRAAELIFRSWVKLYNDIPDAVVVEGPLAGGHLGFKPDQINDQNFALERLIPQVIESLAPFQRSFSKNIPVIAAGGIYEGSDIYRFLQLGASGVQMATRFVATNECDADRAFKEAYIACKKEDIIIIKSPVGMPGRAIQNEFLQTSAKGVKNVTRCAWRCLQNCDIKNSVYCISAALDNARRGDLHSGFVFVGSNAYRVDTITSVESLMDILKAEYETAVIKNCIILKDEYLQAIEKTAQSLVQEYQKAQQTINRLKKELQKSIGVSLDQLRLDYERTVGKFESISKECQLAKQKLNELRMRFPEQIAHIRAFTHVAFNQ